MATLPARRRPSDRSPSYGSRDSNTLRASVLDAALELGIGSSRTVEDWMFNSVAEEEEEETEHVVSPGLTSGSTATSEESSLSAYLHQQNSSPVAAQPPLHIHALSEESITSRTVIDYAPSPVSAPPTQKSNKLRKTKSRKDKSEGDGGYLSDTGKKKGTKKVSKGEETEYETDGEVVKDKKKAKKKEKKSAKDDASGYATDSSFKSPKKSSRKSPSTPDSGDVSDGGYISEASTKKKKKSFFRMPHMSSSSSLKRSTSSPSLASDAHVVPPVPALPAMPSVPAASTMQHPIADLFARNGADGNPRSAPGGSGPVPTQSMAGSRPLDSVVSLYEPPSAPSDAITGSLQPLTLRDQSPPEGESPSQPQSGRRQGVRFTPSTRFSPSEDKTFVAVPPSPLLAPPARPTISLPITRLPSPSPSRTDSPSSARSIPFLTRSLQPRKIPSPLALHSPSPFAGPSSSPVPSDYSVISSSEFVVPSPHPRGISPLPSPRRSHFEIPPPTPPPVGPLPRIPSGLEPASASALSRAPSPSAGPGLFAQPIPSIQRGRELPFPSRPLLPAAESTELVERVRLQRMARAAEEAETPQARFVEARFGGLVVRDEDDVRSDVAQFFFAPENDTASHGRHNEGMAAYPEEIEPAYDAEDMYDAETYGDDRSIYPESEAHTLEAHRSRADVEAYWQDAAGQRASVWSGRASFIDDERSREIRARFVQGVGAMYGEEGDIPPVPKLPVPF
ncbi:hypothetical protein FA95DRAFT_1553110 [Auriscalpium vulgare]|uniref:Uncharacterized protein n=1 Tax=Auriscalpium vulgare TaxID=40419 RepID=A0ACB8S947_9AGAM|nr:hypothetical protein FA95DRAFT_1553110 [Auriscalpium vulgare]